MVNQKKSNNVPLSENSRLFREEYTKEDCIKELRTIAEANTEQVITRNFFRNHSNISESTWNRYFGTFSEFKKQSNIVLSRHAQGLERNIAKHASVDKQRKMNLEKMSYEGNYKKPNNKRWQSIVVGSDMHDVECDGFYRDMFVESIKRVQPEKVVLNGDIFDLPDFSKFTRDPREYKPIERMRWVHCLLKDIREACPDTEITLIEGNHEYRLIRHLTESTPALVTVLSDLHGFTIPKLLGLTEFEVNYYARMDLSCFSEGNVSNELRKNYLIANEQVLFHHFPEGFSMGYAGVNGHHHKHTVKIAYSPMFGTYEWHQLGSGHRRSAVYCAGEKWSNGFAIIHLDTHNKKTHFEYVDTTHDFCMLGGRFYENTKALKNLGEK